MNWGLKPAVLWAGDNMVTRRRDPRIAIAIFASAYFLSHFHRIATGVLALDISRSLHIGTGALGLFSAIYFYAYGAMQIPVGLLSDMYGVRQLTAGLALVAAIGSALMACAPSFPVALLGRLLVGVGVSSVYVPALRFFSRRLPPNQFGTTVGMLVAAGNAGGLAATTPLVFLNSVLGWRATFLVVAAASLSVAVLIWALVDDNPAMHGQSMRGLAEDRAKEAGTRWMTVCIKAILRNRTVVGAALAVAGRYGPHVAFLGVWGALYLRTVHRLSAVAAGGVLMAMSIGYAIGGPALGYVSDRFLRRKVVLAGSTAVCVLGWAPLLITRSTTSFPVLFCLALVMGVAGGGGAVAFSMAKESVQHTHAGTAVAFVNTAGFFGAAIFQSIIGFLLGSRGGVPVIDAGSFFKVIGVSMAGSVLSLACTLGIEEHARRADRSATLTEP